MYAWSSGIADHHASIILVQNENPSVDVLAELTLP